MELVDRLIPRKLLPPGTDWFIAGGYAAHKGLATDIDVWVSTKYSEYTPEQFKDIITGWLHAEGFGAQYATTPDEEFEYDGVTIDIRKVAEVTHSPTGVAYTKPYHIMTTNGHLAEVFANFDVSTHQIAIDSRGRVVFGPDYTAYTVAPVMLRDGGPGTTERMAKISARYAHFREKGQLGQEAE